MISAKLFGDSLLVDQNYLITGTDLLTLMFSWRPVPVFMLGEQAGEAHSQGNLIHITADGRRMTIIKKRLMAMLGQQITAVRCDIIPPGVPA